VGITSEKEDCESRGNNESRGKKNANKDVPPVNIVVQKLIEDFEENEKSDSNNNATNKEDSTPDWEEAAARQVPDFFLSALAEAAAAHEASVLQFLLNLVDGFFGHTHH
jgi:hypothetical protein